MTPLSTPAAQGAELHFVFDDFPNPEGARFIEVEDGSGRSVSAGEWRRREDGLVELVVPMGKDWSYAFDGSTLRDRFGGSFMATEPDINGNVAVLLSQVDAHAIIAMLSASPSPEALPASGVEANERIAKLMQCVEDSAKAEGQWHHRAQVAESALRQIAEHPENSSGTSRSFGVGWAFWNVQNIAKAALRAAALTAAPVPEGRTDG